MLGDAGYDSQKLRNKLLNTNFGKLLKKRIIIEHTILHLT